MINHSKQLLFDHYEKHHYHGAQRRLALALIAVLVTATLIGLVAIDAAQASTVPTTVWSVNS